MRMPIIIQARMSSRRLPGKMLRSLGCGSLLGVLLQGVGRAERADGVIVATSTDPSDDLLAAHCETLGVPCRRGPLDDVYQRFAEIAASLGCEGFIRICGDSPLLDHRLIDRAIALFEESACDLATNVHPRSFPKGQSVEVVNTATFLRVRPEIQAPGHREHLTSFFYDNAERFSIRNFGADDPWQDLQMSVDTQADLDRIKAVLARLDRPHGEYGWRELAALARRIDEEGTC